VGDTLYGAAAHLTPAEVDSSASRARRRSKDRGMVAPEILRLNRNFLHAARLEFEHPLTGKPVALEAPLPAELKVFHDRLQAPSAPRDGSDSRDTGTKVPAKRRPASLLE
jgi:23S rRNA pseudouridine1911/1915/1917 synthase